MKNWGGSREGAGRKRVRKNWSDKFKTALWKSLEGEAKKQGMTVFDLFSRRIFECQNDFVFVSLWRSLCDILATKETLSTIEQHQFGPVIGLPEIKKPAGTIPIITSRQN
jgi:hypothetical protein